MRDAGVRTSGTGRRASETPARQRIRPSGRSARCPAARGPPVQAHHRAKRPANTGQLVVLRRVREARTVRRRGSARRYCAPRGKACSCRRRHRSRAMHLLRDRKPAGHASDRPAQGSATRARARENVWPSLLPTGRCSGSSSSPCLEKRRDSRSATPTVGPVAACRVALPGSVAAASTRRISRRWPVPALEAQ
jgi:hypothetical protein